jgi:hypothetical protein
MTNVEAYLWEAVQLEHKMTEWGQSGRIRQPATANPPQVRSRAYSCEQLPSGCILFRMSPPSEFTLRNVLLANSSGDLHPVGDKQ